MPTLQSCAEQGQRVSGHCSQRRLFLAPHWILSPWEARGTAVPQGRHHRLTSLSSCAASLFERGCGTSDGEQASPGSPAPYARETQLSDRGRGPTWPSPQP